MAEDLELQLIEVIAKLAATRSPKWHLAALGAVSCLSDTVKRAIINASQEAALQLIEASIAERGPATNQPGRVKLNLADISLKLEPYGEGQIENMYALCNPRTGKVEQLFYDPTGIIGRLRSYLKSNVSVWGRYTEGSGLPALYVNGLVKTGKSCVLNIVLLAVLRDDDFFGVGKDNEMVVMRLDFSAMPVDKGYDAMLRWLLQQILLQAKELNLQSVALQYATEVLDSPELGPVIMGIFKTLTTPTLITVDEAQTLLQPRDPKTQKIDKASQGAARRLLKELMCKSSTTCLWAMTGSSMAQFWVQMGLAPPNGVSPLHWNCTVNLPSTHAEVAVTCVQNFLEKRLNITVPTADTMLPWKTNAALLTYLSYQYKAMGAASAVILAEKIVLEIVNEWAPLLQDFDDSKRRAFLGLAQGDEGLELSSLNNMGLQRMLEGLTEPIRPDSQRRKFSSAYQTWALTLMIDEEGKLCSDWKQVANQFLGLSEAWRLLTDVGNVMKRLLKAGDSDKLEKVLKDTVLALEAEHGHGTAWRTKKWFTAVWFSRYNQGSKATERANSEADVRGTAKAYQDAADGAPDQQTNMSSAWHLAWYLAMLRNCLCHNEQEVGTQLQLPHGDTSARLLLDSPVAQPLALVRERFAAVLAEGDTSTTAVQAPAQAATPAATPAAQKAVAQGHSRRCQEAAATQAGTAAAQAQGG
eukprot:CAMPEP_0202892048 /NCGR_PEP_ID=MMETSP1392-20130828/1903_1 /ASSEMBLY_ACC=CAM_ASM_000868 /TAXON_ID=225041 /ORGANISM="Chlamydomonas chlamydogama, Strain SAG 11-48b" /LENGTH=696 /DNA_ID=CAMNT_0049575923 /DNA_START=225 /DNA_END=2312 /DNA_ORIENTATION=-